MLYYFAYGSNMLTKRLNQRCPGARRVGRADAADHAIEFSNPSIDKSGKATVRRQGSSVSKSAWISAGKVSAAIAAVALLLGAVFQGQAQQRSDMADVRAELRSGFAEVNGRFTEVNIRLENISGDLVSLRERVARIEGQLVLPTDSGTQANMAPETEEDG